MSNKIVLRDYQEKAVAKAVWAVKLPENDLLVLPTGSGKSIITSEIAHRLQKPILILQPNKEILEQNYEKLCRYIDPWDIGIYSASMNERTIRKFNFATIGSIYKKAHLFAHIGLCIIDEADTLNMKNTASMYTSFIIGINKLRHIENMRFVREEQDSDYLFPLKIIGLTATPYRNMTGYHTGFDGELYSTTTLKLINRVKPEFWRRILFNISIGDLIAGGYLCPLKYEQNEYLTHEQIKLNATETGFDLEDYGVKLGAKQQQIVDCVRDAQQKFKSVLVFCPSVYAANKFAAVVAGSRAVSAKTQTDDRNAIIKGFKNGDIQTVWNMGVLTRGFDHPALECIILLRPTRSLALHVQMIGRGLRTSPGKEFCTIIDWSGNVKSLGGVETIEVRKEQFPEFKHPMWDIFSQTDKGEERWHNRPLYTFKVKKKAKNAYHFQRSRY